MRDITLCHPRLQTLAAQLVEECAQQGLKIKIGETLRTVAEQDAYYAKGRTVPPIGKQYTVTNAPGSSYSSYHQWGTAFDFFRNDGKGAYNESDRFFERVGAIGVQLGLEWGGNWKSIIDKPHFQLPDWGSGTGGIKALYRTPEEFMKTWKPEKKSGWYDEDGGRRFYNGDTGECVRNKWHKEPDGTWYWFDGAGMMVRDVWYQYDDGHGMRWYYLGDDGVMRTGLQTIDGKWYYLDQNGRMSTEPVVLTPDQDGALRWPGLSE